MLLNILLNSISNLKALIFNFSSCELQLSLVIRRIPINEVLLHTVAEKYEQKYQYMEFLVI